MARKLGNQRIDIVLSKKIRNLIARKVQLLRQEQEELLAPAAQLAYKKLNGKIITNLGSPKFSRILSTIQVTICQDIAFTASAITRRWPGIVWESITSVLSKLPHVSYDGKVLNKLIDQFAWRQDQTPFTADYLGADRLGEAIYHALSQCGVDEEESRELLNKELILAAGLAKCTVMSAAIRAREEIGIAIDEYVMDQHLRRGNFLEIAVDPNNEHANVGAHACSAVMNVSDQLEVFRSMEKLTSDELSFMFVGDKTESDLGPNNMLEISARNVSRRVALSDFDLVDRRRGCLNRQGAMLLVMADTRSPLISPSNMKIMYRLRVLIRKHLGVKDDPLYRYSKGTGWAPRFSVTDRRGSADERARQDAERHTVSYEQLNIPEPSKDTCHSEYPYEVEKDETGEWMENRDPNHRS